MNADPQQSWWVLRIIFGGMAILSGLDKYLNILIDWSRCLRSFVPSVLNIAADTFMFFVGAVEILVGIAIFTRYTQYAAVVLRLWLLVISLTLLACGVVGHRGTIRCPRRR